jgi:catechol 2,3-dioxygenase-like lactoylglutathione lyase family enzyme
VRDIDASLRFYRDTLGFVPTGEAALPHRHIWILTLGGQQIRLVLDREPPSETNPRVGANSRVHGYFMLAIRTRNGATVTAELEAAGYEIEIPWRRMGSGSFELEGLPEDAGYAYVRDPDGNMIELVQGPEGLGWSPPSDAFRTGSVPVTSRPLWADVAGFDPSPQHARTPR